MPTYESRSKWLKTTLLQEFFVRDVHKTMQSVRAPPKAITWDHTRQSIKLGVNQANTGVHIHRMGKTDDGISTCALFPAVTISFGIQLSLSLSLARFFCFFSSLSLYLSLSLSVVFVANFLRTMSCVGGVI